VIDQLFTLPSTIERLRQGPLSDHLDAYATTLNAQGYALQSIRTQVVLIADFSRWLQSKRTEIRNLDRRILDGFLRYRRRRVRVQRGDVAALNRLLTLLGQWGIVEQPGQATVRSPRQSVSEEFRRYLSVERGLSQSTQRGYVPFIDQFLAERFQNKALNLSQLRAADVTGFVQRHAHQLSPGRAKLW
jgi:site-specific recombinase XerD